MVAQPVTLIPRGTGPNIGPAAEPRPDRIRWTMLALRRALRGCTGWSLLGLSRGNRAARRSGRGGEPIVTLARHEASIGPSWREARPPPRRLHRRFSSRRGARHRSAPASRWGSVMCYASQGRRLGADQGMKPRDHEVRGQACVHSACFALTADGGWAVGVELGAAGGVDQPRWALATP